MSTAMIVAIVGAMSMLGVGGAAMASEDVGKMLGMGSGDGDGNMHQWSHQHQWSHAGNCTAPYSYDYNYSYSYDYDCLNETCPCA